MNVFVRFQSVVPNRHGRFPGVFALANGLGASGRLSAEDQAWLRTSNTRAHEIYTDPSTVERECYDPLSNPWARSWFRSSAGELLTFTSGYLDLLDRYGVGWAELRTRVPGRVVYEDDVQVVAVPPVYPDDWPFAR